MKGHQRKARLKPARNLGGKMLGENLCLQEAALDLHLEMYTMLKEC